jgi:fructose-bisphosphate aldolase, class I
MENTLNNMAQVEEYLGREAENLLTYKVTCIPKERLTVPGPFTMDKVFGISDRNVQVLKSLSSIYQHGRLSGTGYLSILPVDQGIEHTAGSSFAPNTDYFDPENIIKLAIEGGCNGVVTTFGGPVFACSEICAQNSFYCENKSQRTAYLPQ